jgi:hypothetical protein
MHYACEESLWQATAGRGDIIMELYPLKTDTWRIAWGSCEKGVRQKRIPSVRMYSAKGLEHMICTRSMYPSEKDIECRYIFRIRLI